MIPGSVYGVVLNDKRELERLADAFASPPYLARPKAPVVHIKPRSCVTTGGAPVVVPDDAPELVAAATVALLFGHRPGVPVAAALALDVFVPHADYYRPAIRQRCRDGFLPIGAFGHCDPGDLGRADLVTTMSDGTRYAWPLAHLARSAATLIADLGSFMTLGDGDALLIGIAGDAPRVRAGMAVRVDGAGLPPLRTHFVAEAAA